MDEAIRGYATAWVAYQTGTRYGHWGEAPDCPESLPGPWAEHIRRAASWGMRTALARRQGDESRALSNQEYARKLWPLARAAGMTRGQWDTAFAAGYKS